MILFKNKKKRKDNTRRMKRKTIIWNKTGKNYPNILVVCEYDRSYVFPRKLYLDYKQN